MGLLQKNGTHEGFKVLKKREKTIGTLMPASENKKYPLLLRQFSRREYS
jgi:hypothetical protein